MNISRSELIKSEKLSQFAPSVRERRRARIWLDLVRNHFPSLPVRGIGRTSAAMARGNVPGEGKPPRRGKRPRRGERPRRGPSATVQAVDGLVQALLGALERVGEGVHLVQEAVIGLADGLRHLLK